MYQRIVFIISIMMLTGACLLADLPDQKDVDYSKIEKYWMRDDYRGQYLQKVKEDYKKYMASKKVLSKSITNETVEQSLSYGQKSDRNILLIISQKLYNPGTMENFDIYINDLESEGYSVKMIKTTNESDIVAFRNMLFEEWQTDSIEGAFLIGSLPVAWFEMPILDENSGDTTDWDFFPTDLYFMDLDGVWEDREGENEIFDYHGGSLQMDIWIGRLYTPTMTLHSVTESQLVNRYLMKAHNYRGGTLRLKDQGFSYVQEDWAGFHMENEVLKLYDEVTYINDGINGSVTKLDYQSRIRASTNNKYEWMYLGAHSYPQGHGFKDYDFTSDEIEPLDVQIHFYLNFNCSAARYTDNDCLCSWYVMQDPWSLISIGSTKGGSMLDQGDYYMPLSEGKTIGEAFKYWGVRHFETRDWHYGVICVGDPTLKISRFMEKAGPKYCYAIEPGRDEMFRSTDITFKWTNTDSADYYIVELSDEDTFEWTSNHLTDTIFTISPEILAIDNTYRWTVKAYNNEQCFDFSQFRYFTIIDTTNTFLSSFPIYYTIQDWGSLGINTSCEGNPISIAGQMFEKGFGTHANSTIKIRLEGRFDRFSTWVGHDDEVNCGDGVAFRVKLDSQTIYQNGKIYQHGTSPDYIELDVSGGDMLELLVFSGADNSCDHADWGNAKVWTIENAVTKETNASIPEEITLLGNYPNPFNSSTTISFISNQDEPISLVIYNVLGQEVKRLIDQKRKKGKYEIVWDGTDTFNKTLTSGIYFYKLITKNKIATDKMLLIK